MRGALLGFLAVAALGLAGASLVRGPAAEAVYVALAVAFPVALAALGALGAGRRGRAAATGLVVLGLALEAGFFWLRAVAGRAAEGPWPGGLPLAVWVLLGGVWLLPVVAVSALYAWSFEPRQPEATPEPDGEGAG